MNCPPVKKHVIGKVMTVVKGLHLDFVISGDRGTIKREVLLVESSLENYARDSSRKWNCSCDWLKSGKECGSNVSSRSFRGSVA